MSFPPKARRIAALSAITLSFVTAAFYYALRADHFAFTPNSAAGLLTHADTLAWGNRWVEAKPLYAQATALFQAQNQPSKALYATVSEIPADESVSIPGTILQLTTDLAKPEARDPEVELRILTIRGMLETDYDASQALANWERVGSLALQLHHYELATRAEGEQGIAAFLLGDTDTAKKKVLRAWGLSKVERDPAATVRYASVFGAGLVQIHRYKEALTTLNQAIGLAATHPDVAYPTIAIYAKIDALRGLHQYDQAMQLANDSLARLQGTVYQGHRAQVYIARAAIEAEQGNLKASIDDYAQAVSISQRMENYRGITDAAGGLAHTYEQGNQLPEALAAIDEAITANTKIPDELYLVPRNLATKAEIEDKLGHAQESNMLYRKGIALIDRMIQHASTVSIQRQLLAEMSDVYSGYFASLCAQNRFNEALQILDNVRGRVETEALEHHANQPVHTQTPEERELTRLNLSLINTDDPATRARLTDAIYSTELRMSPSSLATHTITHPVQLPALQSRLSPNELLLNMCWPSRLPMHWRSHTTV